MQYRPKTLLNHRDIKFEARVSFNPTTKFNPSARLTNAAERIGSLYMHIRAHDFKLRSCRYLRLHRNSKVKFFTPLLKEISELTNGLKNTVFFSQWSKRNLAVCFRKQQYFLGQLEPLILVLLSSQGQRFALRFDSIHAHYELVLMKRTCALEC